MTDRTSTYSVEGMSCGHCEAAVRAEVERVEEVDGVEVDLETKRVRVRGGFEDAAVREAIESAGYEAA